MTARTCRRFTPTSSGWRSSLCRRTQTASPTCCPLPSRKHGMAEASLTNLQRHQLQPVRGGVEVAGGKRRHHSSARGPAPVQHARLAGVLSPGPLIGCRPRPRTSHGPPPWLPSSSNRLSRQNKNLVWGTNFVWDHAVGDARSAEPRGCCIPAPARCMCCVQVDSNRPTERPIAPPHC